MPFILRKLPFFEDQRALRVPDGPVVTIKHHQILVWVSITPPGLPAFPEQARRLPAILDTGFNDTLLIQEEQLRSWGGISPPDLELLDYLTVSGRRIPMVDMDVWLHVNLPGHRDQFASRPPFRLELNTGIAVIPDPTTTPRLPLLGMLALRRAKLHLHVDYEHCRITLRTPRRFWFFG